MKRDKIHSSLSKKKAIAKSPNGRECNLDAVDRHLFLNLLEGTTKKQTLHELHYPILFFFWFSSTLV